MINSRAELKYYIEQDKLADKITRKRPIPFLITGGGMNLIWKYKIYLRKTEYYKNTAQGFLKKIAYFYYLINWRRLGVKLGFSIGLNCFKEGLSLPHYGTIIINENARIGKNCRVLPGVVIGATSGNPQGATIGDNVYIGVGAK